MAKKNASRTLTTLRHDGSDVADLFANLTIAPGDAFATAIQLQSNGNGKGNGKGKGKGKGKKEKRRDIVREFQYYFGNDNSLENWQRLCRDVDIDVGVDGELGSITKCRKALKKVWVNIYDLLDAQKCGEVPRRFRNQAELAEYTVETGRVFPKKAAKEGGPARVLLAHIFR